MALPPLHPTPLLMAPPPFEGSKAHPWEVAPKSSAALGQNEDTERHAQQMLVRNDWILGAIAAKRLKPVSGSAGGHIRQMEALTQAVFRSWPHYRPEDSWLANAKLEVKVVRHGKKSLGNFEAATKLADRIDRELRLQSGRATEGVWPIDERPLPDKVKEAAADQYDAEALAGHRPEVFFVSVKATSGDKEKSFEGVVFAMPGPKGMELVDVDLMRRLFPTTPEPSDVAEPGAERSLSRYQLSEIDQRSQTRIARHLDIRYDEVMRRFTQVFHADGATTRESVNGALDEHLKEMIHYKLSELGLRDRDGQPLRLDQIQLGNFKEALIGIGLDFKVRDAGAPLERARGELVFDTDGGGAARFVTYKKLTVDNFELARTNMAELGIDVSASAVGQWLATAERQSNWRELHRRGLVLTESPS